MAVRRPWILWLTAIILLIALLLSLINGSENIPLSVVSSAITKTGKNLDVLEGIIWNLRLPRALMAALVGGSLAVAGATMQGLFRNPLADPYLTGVASGAAFGATLVLTLAGGLAAGYMVGPFANRFELVPLGAFFGALLAVSATILLSRIAKQINTSLILAGVIVGSILTSATTFLLLRDADRMRAAFNWTLGNLSLAGWTEIGRILPYSIIGFAIIWFFARQLDALQLGEDTAKSLGIRLNTLQTILIVASSLMTAASVAFVGIIGFVGLVAPHIMRRLVGPKHSLLIPASLLGGSAMLVLADLGAKSLLKSAELPIGIVTSLIGGPFFLWILTKYRSS